LSNGNEDLAFRYLGMYECFLDSDLFLYSLRNNNRAFLQNSLKTGAFNKQIFKEDDIAEQIMSELEYGSKINNLLNILVLIDIK